MLKAALNLAFKHKKVASDLAWRHVEPFHAVDEARKRFLSIKEAARLINSCDREFRPVVEAGLQTGCRYSELAKLEVADYNPDSGTVHIRKSKSGEARHVHLTQEGARFFAEVCAGRARLAAGVVAQLGHRQLMQSTSDGSNTIQRWRSNGQRFNASDLGRKKK